MVDDPDLDAVLVERLSGIPLLERAEIPKIAREQALAGVGLKLDGAGQVLVVERGDAGGAMRLVEVSSGAVVFMAHFPPMPVSEAAQWVALRVRPFAGESAAATGRRISLPGLRFVSDSPENRLAERRLNLAVAARLQERGALVLERWRTRDLVFEKSVTSDVGPFWRAARIVDGSLERGHGRLAARIRVRGADGMERGFETGASELEALATLIADGVLGAEADARGAPGGVDEGEVYLAEARWMFRHGLMREAWQAAEAALALGVERAELQVLRVRAAAACAYPDNLERPHSHDGGYRPDAFDPEELARRVEMATEAMLFAGDYRERYPTEKQPEWWSIEHPATLGVNSLYTGLRLLRAARESGRDRVGEAALADLRRAVRRNAAALRDGRLGTRRATLHLYLANYAADWCETPEEAVAFYREILAPDFDAGIDDWPKQLRSELCFGDQPRPPFLVGEAPAHEFHFGIGNWRVPPHDPARAKRVWSGFLEELARSPSVLHRADALALRWRSTADERARYALTADAVDFVTEHADDFAGPGGPTMFEQLIEPLRDVNREAGLRAAQEKLVEFFLRLIRLGSPAGAELLPVVWVAFTDGNVNIREEQGRALLSALDERASRPGIAKVEWNQVDAARSSLLREFPGFRAAALEAKNEPLAVRRLWIASEHVPADFNEPVGFSDQAVVWAEGRLWVLDPHRGRLWRIDPRRGASEVLSPRDRPETGYGSQLVAWGGRLAITTGDGVHVLDEEKTRWTKLELPPARYRIGVAGDALWAVSGEDNRTGAAKFSEGNTLHRISSDLVCDLVASSRRRPATHPLDVTLSGEPFDVSAARGGGVVIGAWGAKTTFLESEGRKPHVGANGAGNLQLSNTPGLVLHSKHRGGSLHALVRAQFLNAESNELLLLHPAERAGSAKVRFAYPDALETIPAREYAAAWGDEGLDVLAWSSRASPWGAAEAWIVRIDDTGSAVVPMHFVWPADGDARAREARSDAKTFRYPLVEPKGLIATDDGLVITGRGMMGFWFLPREDINAWRRENEPPR